VAAALAEMDEVGEAAFSLRRVAARLGRDPMAILYHLGSKEGLERAVAEALNTEVAVPDPALPPRKRLEAVAWDYRALAKRHPRSFPLLLRFWTTGPADLRVAEAVYRALEEAGLPPEAVVDFGCGFYAALLGLCAGEVGGLLASPPPEFVQEVRESDPDAHPALHRLLDTLSDRHPDALFVRTVAVLLDGIESAARASLDVDGLSRQGSEQN
jgi:AcrR family transcriptional regulator